MGKLLTKKLDTKKISEEIVTTPKNNKIELYKPIENFAWKDASRNEINKNSIRAYRDLAF